MPNRPAKKTRLGKRPPWNVEPDYFLREHQRLQVVNAIRRDADRFIELSHECPGCSRKVWEAQKDETIWRGCHCITIMLPLGHMFYEFTPESWKKAIQRAVQVTSAPPEGKACVRTLTKIHPSLHDDPFSVIKGSLTGTPQSLGFHCGSCNHPVRRGFTSAQLTGFEFSVLACGCTGLIRFANLGDPSAEQWREIVLEAARLAPGDIKVHTKVMDEPPDAGGTN